MQWFMTHVGCTHNVVPRFSRYPSRQCLHKVNKNVFGELAHRRVEGRCNQSNIGLEREGAGRPSRTHPTAWLWLWNSFYQAQITHRTSTTRCACMLTTSARPCFHCCPCSSTVVLPSATAITTSVWCSLLQSLVATPQYERPCIPVAGPLLYSMPPPGAVFGVLC